MDGRRFRSEVTTVRLRLVARAATNRRQGSGFRRTRVLDLNKIYWPAEKYTKGDLVDYYRGVSKWLLPYLANRPWCVYTVPDGIDGKSFYQKDAPVFAPEWIRTVRSGGEDTQREIKFFICDDEESLLYLANMGSIPIHIGRASGIARATDCA